MRASARPKAGRGGVLLAVCVASCARSHAPRDAAASRLATLPEAHSELRARVETLDASSSDASSSAIAPSAMLVGDQPVRVDSTERARVTDATGRSIRPGSALPGIDTASPGAEFFAGDRIETGEHGARIRLRDGTEIALGPLARVIVPEFPGSDLVVSRGEVSVERSPNAGVRTPVVVDGPGGRVLAQHGRTDVVVADDGEMLAGSPDATTVIRPSPPAPASTIGARIHREHHGAPGHPVSLDVQVNELEAQTSRPLDRVIVPAGHAIAFAPDGHSLGVRTVSFDDASLARWRADAERENLRPGYHTIPIAQMARAGAGDLADARALIEALHRSEGPRVAALARPDASVGTAMLAGEIAEDERANVETQLSAALGRAHARADRGRVLAQRGGDVTSLVALAPFEDVLAAARQAMAPRSPTRMLDSH